MRMLLKATIPVEAGNNAIKQGTLGKTMSTILDQLKPEAAYFCADSGKRTCYIVFDMKSPADIPSIAEPFFIGLNAEIEFKPCMDVADMQAGVARAMAAV